MDIAEAEVKFREAYRSDIASKNIWFDLWMPEEDFLKCVIVTQKSKRSFKKTSYSKVDIKFLGLFHTRLNFKK